MSERALNRSGTSGMRRVLERLPVALARVGRRGRIVFANEHFARSYAVDQTIPRQLRSAAAEAAPSWQSLRLVDVNGTAVQSRVLPIGDDGGCLLIVDETAVSSRVRELEARVAALEAMAVTDPLTGAWNRVQLERMVELELARGSRSQRPSTLVLLDIDHFKDVNDRYGHLVGDAVLKQFVRRVRDHIRRSDMLFRWGGEEFVILATDTSYRGGRMLAEKLRLDIERHPFDGVGPLRASLGVAEHPDGAPAEAWFRPVDDVLYAAKNDGRNCVHVDCRGASDRVAGPPGAAVLRLEWSGSFECGHALIDREHRELFELGTGLIALGMPREQQADGFRAALEALFGHIERHFCNEERVLAEARYEHLRRHRDAHAGLLAHARSLACRVDAGEASLGDLIDFLVTDVITEHLSKVDRDYFPLFA